MAGVERKVTLMLTLLAHSDDDISSSVAPFAHDYLGLLKTLPSLSAQQAANVQVTSATRVDLIDVSFFIVR